MRQWQVLEKVKEGTCITGWAKVGGRTEEVIMARLRIGHILLSST